MKRAACFGFGVVSILLALSVPCLAGSATQPAPQEPKPDTFLLVDVKGTIGEDFTAGNLKAALAEARASKAAAVVLNMDTPGGSIQDAEAIVNLIIENKDLRFIALVHKALSAGAAITLACKEIYVTEAATIGAAVSYTVNGRGQLVELPPDLAEKMQSAWRAVCRKAADHGEHSSLLAEGMVDKDFGVVMKKDKGKVALERVDRSSAMPKGEVIKPQGRILTLTAKEAIACELAKALVADTAGFAKSLGIRLAPTESGDAKEPGSDGVLTPEDIIAALPKEFLPTTKGSWDELKLVLASKWLSNNYRLKRARIVSVYDPTSVFNTDDRVDLVASHAVVINAKPATVIGICGISPASFKGLATLMKGDSIAIEGTILGENGMEICDYSSDERGIIVRIRIANCTIMAIKKTKETKETSYKGTSETNPAADPETFYDRLFAKIDALGLDGDSLTELARKKAEQEVNSWFTTEWGKVKGTRVSWNLVLMEAKPPKGSTFQVSARARKGKKKEVTISANVRLAFKEAVASISPGQPITLTGTLRTIDGRVGTTFGSYMKIQMDDCVVGKEDQPSVSGKATASTTAPADPEAEAKRRLNLAETYRTNGMHAQAAKALRSIIDDFPKTASAKRAAEDLAEVEKEMKEGSSPNQLPHNEAE